MLLKYNTQYSSLVLIVLSILFFSSFTNQISSYNDPCQKHNSLNSFDTCIVKSHLTQINIISVEEIEVREILEMENSGIAPLSSIHLWINHSLNSLEIEDVSGVLSFDIVMEIENYCFLKIYLSKEVQYQEFVKLYITYHLDEFPFAEESNSYYFEFYSTITYFTAFHYFSIRLPDECYIKEEGDLTSIFPRNESKSFIGKRLIVSWVLIELSPTSNPFYFIRFETPRNLTWLYVIGPLLGLIAGIVGTLWFMRGREKTSIKSMGTVFLNESQKILLKITFENGGKIAQKDLCKKSGFTRSKTSRNLIALDEQGFVIKEKWGRNSLIKLTKLGEKVIE